ncbi:MAG: DUF2520 domain-containing protein [Rhodoluna sp.]|nr:DUF2520 domain-containing protein [Rhodoluna sp.]
MSSRLNVAVIGAGPAGLAIAKAVFDAGHCLMAIATTDPARAEQVATVLPGVTIAPVIDAVQNVDLVIFAIPGKEIVPLVSGLVKTESLSRGQLVVHTSPDYGYEVFDEGLSLGIVPMAMHPAIRFTGISSIDRTRLMDSYIAVDSPKAVLPVVQTLAIELGGEPVHVPFEARAKYAEAISVASSFTSLIVGQAITLLEDANIDKSRSILSGIMRSALEESLRSAVVEIDPADLLEGDSE